jgi:type IV pilus assembly protein PilB
MAFRIQSLPLSQTEETLFVAMVDPYDVFILNEIRVRVHSRYKLKSYLAFPKDIEYRLNQVYGKTNEDAIESAFKDIADEEAKEIQSVSVIEEGEGIDLETVALEQAQGSFVIGYVTKLIYQAIREEASDIHIEPFPRETILRYRVDGDLSDRPMSSKAWHNAIVSRIKIMASMNIAERRIPQDGRIPLRVGSKKYELRVSIIPTAFGESVVMRILDKSGITRTLSDLGFSKGNLALFEEAIHKPYGLILVCGPTGSGKSTTLFAALNAINSPDIKILTVENPVEYNLPGIIQVQTKEDIDPPLTFASALRAFLRQDPDVIMVGEMRDQETAAIGIQAALTGHLVFSTIHTNDAPSSVTRLVNFGIDPFLIGDAVLLIISQRLPNTICKNCKVPVEPTEEQIKLFETYKIDTSNLQLSRGEGCNRCNGKGMKGRMAIHEVMAMNNTIREAILKGASGYEIKGVAIDNGMKTLRQDGLAKAARGLTTIDMILQMT